MFATTHVLTGACMGRAGLNRTTGLATATLALSAEIPDIDFLVYFFADPVTGFAHHRGFTHAFIGIPFDALLTLAFIYPIYRFWLAKRRSPCKLPPRWGVLFLLACLGALSHILLDFTNNYGVHPFLPFHDAWYSWDIIFIIEPLLDVPMLLALVVPGLFRLVSEEIGVRERGPRGRLAAVLALSFMVLVWGVKDYHHRRAIALLDNQVYRGAEPLRVAANPYMATPFRWHGVVETRHFYLTVPVNTGSDEVVERDMIIYPRPEENEITAAARRSRTGQVYLAWAAFPLIEVEKLEDGYMVRFYDLRYAYPDRRPSVMSLLRGRHPQDRPRRPLRAGVRLDQQLNVVAEFWGDFQRERLN